jgi:branched-chain amino acid transport system permease protein
MRAPRPLQVALFVAAAAAAQLLAVGAGKGFLLTQLTMSAHYTLAALGLSLLMGFAGQISLGQAGFFALGGYASAFLTTWDLSAHRAAPLVRGLAAIGAISARPDLYGGQLLTLHPWAAFAGALALSVALAFVVGIPVLKLRGHYLAMATLAVGTIVYSVALGTTALGAADGISAVPPFPLLPGVAVGGAASARVANYYVAIGLLAIAMLLLLNLVESRVGRALRAIHGAEDAAGAMGVDAARYKLGTFVLGAALAAVAGTFLTHFNGGIGPSEASIMKSVRYLSIVAVGGMGSLWGTVCASLVLNFLSLRGYFGSFDDAVFGAILVAVMLFAPDGVLTLHRRWPGGLLRSRAGVRTPAPAAAADDAGADLGPIPAVCVDEPGSEERSA